MLLVVLASKDESNVVDQPFSVYPHEFVTEWVGLDAAHQLLDIVGAIKAVDGGCIYPAQVLIASELPELELASQRSQGGLKWHYQSPDATDVGHERRVAIWVVGVPDHGSETQIEEEDAPSRQVHDVVVLRREAHVVNRSPGVRDGAV